MALKIERLTFLRQACHPVLRFHGLGITCHRRNSSKSSPNAECPEISVCGRTFPTDSWTNITPRIISLTNRKLHLSQKHPLGLIKRRIVDFMYKKYDNHRGNPLFSVHENLSPVVNLHQNFDSLLVPRDHPSRKKSDSYYINQDTMLRAHTSAHQTELISMGLDNFLVVGDVYRRDEVDASHYPVFHQMEGVRLFEQLKFFDHVKGPKQHLQVFEAGVRTNDKQECHTLDSAKVVELDLKECLLSLAKDLFGSDIEYRWVDCYFPFTHPSWELEIFWKGDWLEVLGCGIIEQEILNKCGAQDKLGWAFGLGLERLAMKLYQVPDIRVFWSTDPGFLTQFDTDDPRKEIAFVPVSKFPPCTNDISFWLPDENYSPNDFYDIVRSIGGDLVERVELFDSFYHPKKKLHSHSYRVTYRSMDKTLKQTEVNLIHSQIEAAVTEQLKVTIR